MKEVSTLGWCSWASKDKPNAPSHIPAIPACFSWFLSRSWPVMTGAKDPRDSWANEEDLRGKLNQGSRYPALVLWIPLGFSARSEHSGC